MRDGFNYLISSISCTKHALPVNGKMSVQVFRDNTVFANEVFAAGGRRLFSMFRHALVQVPESVAYIPYTTLCVSERPVQTFFCSEITLPAGKGAEDSKQPL